MIRTLLFSLFLIGAIAMPALAQEKAPDATPQAAVKNDPDYAKKLELAQQMHKIRPVKTQVQEAVDQVSKSLSPEDRDSLRKMVEKAFDYDKLEKISTDTMIQLFTVAELQKMVDYFGSPEAKSIAEKLPKYQEILQPEIIRMLDAAMLAQRTGGTAPPPPAPANKAVATTPDKTGGKVETFSSAKP